MKSLPRWALLHALQLAEAAREQGSQGGILAAERLVAEIDRCLQSQRPKPATRAKRAKKKATRKALVADIRPQVVKRAQGICECGCNTPFAWGLTGCATWDEFWGRGKEEATVESSWMLRLDHHDAKSNEKPSRRRWLEVFRAHCIRHEYWGEAAKAGHELSVLDSKEALPVSTGAAT